MKFSVLISIYTRSNPLMVRHALQSVYDQSCRPTEVVIVKDGPLTIELDHVVAEFVGKYSIKVLIIQLKKNVGLAKALNKGLAHTSYDLVARMDCDDICDPRRFEIQINLFKTDPDLDICGGQLGNVGKSSEISRNVPRSPSSISTFAKLQSPFNHQTVMYRKSQIEKIGLYPNFRRAQDYALWMKALQHGLRMKNSAEILVRVQISDEKKTNLRSRLRQLYYEIQVAWFGLNIKFFSITDFTKYFVIITTWRLLPSLIQHRLRKFL